MKSLIVLLAVSAALAFQPVDAGPLSKFEGKSPIADYETAAKIGDVERCLIDADAAPLVYRQPDRPGAVTLLWTANPGVAVARVDLEQAPKGTHVRGWLAEKTLRRCAP